MVAIAKFVLSDSGMDELLQSEGVRAELNRRAQNVLEAARSGAPRGETGAYVESLQILADTHSRTGSDGHSVRAAVHIGANVPHATRVEALHGTLARALDAAR